MARYYSGEGIPTLDRVLDDYMNSNELRPLVKLTGQKVPTRKADLVAAIKHHLEGARLETVWQGLDELQQAAVAEVVHSDSSHFPARQFAAKYGREPDWGSRGRRGHVPSALEFFFYHGVMPDDLKARLKAFVPEPDVARVETVSELPTAYQVPSYSWDGEICAPEDESEATPLTVHQTEAKAQRELHSVLRLIDSGKVGVSATTRRPSAATIKAVTNILEDGDFYPVLSVKDRWYDPNAGPIRAFAWPLIVQAGGLAQLSGSRLQLTGAGRSALSRPAAETLSLLWSRWLDTALLDEMSRIDCVKGQTGNGKRGLTAVAPRRQSIDDTLAACPPGTWISAEALSRFMCALGNDFAVSRNAGQLYLGNRHYGSLGHSGGAQILDDRYLLAFLLEYAATLGVIDVALIPPAGARPDYFGLWGADQLAYFSRYDGLIYLRITALGAYCVGAVFEYEAAPVEAQPVLNVLPNLEITALSRELEPGDRMALDTYATRVSDRVWRLEQSTLLAAVQQGRPIDEVREFLHTRSSVPIPDTVTRLIDDVAMRSTQLQDQGLARLIECRDPALAALIAHDSRTQKHCMFAGERHLVVPASSEAAFSRTLREVGYLVASEGARSAPTGRGAPYKQKTPKKRRK